jgi:hypothetical protein
MTEVQQRDDLLARLAAIPSRIALVVAGWNEARLRAPASDGGLVSGRDFCPVSARMRRVGRSRCMI